MKLAPFVLSAALTLTVVGFTPSRSDRAAFDRGELVVAGAGVRVYSPTGRMTHHIESATGAKRVEAQAAALDANGTLYVAPNAPVVRVYNPDGSSRGTLGSYPDGFVVTAMDANASHLYVAISDGGFLHQIYRSTLQGLTEFPILVDSQVTSLEVAADDCTLFYATADRGIRRRDVCGGDSDVLVANVRANDIALLPDSTLLVTPQKGSSLLRMNGSGKVVRRYRGPRVKAWQAVSVTPEGSSFWAATRGGVLYRFSLGSGRRERGPIKTIASLRELIVVGTPQGPAPPPVAGKQEASLELDGVPTLTGEGFVAVDNAPVTSPVNCTAPSPATMAFSTTGTASGPYPGGYTASQTASIGRQTVVRPSGPLGVDVGKITKLGAQFSVTGGGGRLVNGTLLLPKKPSKANTGACLVFQHQTFPRAVVFSTQYQVSGYYRNIHARRIGYEAAIRSGARTYVDRGNTALFTDQSHVVGDDDGHVALQGTRLTQTFRSRLISVTDQFASKSVQQPHFVRVRGNRKTLTLTVRWKRPSDAFTLKGIRLVRPSAWRPQSERKLKPGKLKPGGVVVRTTRKGKTLKVVITKLKPGELRFTVAPAKLGGSTTVATTLESPSG